MGYAREENKHVSKNCHAKTSQVIDTVVGKESYPQYPECFWSKDLNQWYSRYNGN